ncbi:amino acid starvation-responsive transcription factor GCN4 [Aspergillus homomorphus CBS 101889]|uniref:BZIP domain-containing protein n=1 Tax=Aspergillus homomorphus (strain CBS 101889) TaxID=1450537 RepID=A0A395IB02_ASPHC|nr:hypothetical protein BO97DRAFT_409673 [Aspergillus homomorphus CBS 101889]RAL17201.1 hypothetical protein BO97DRAFT_409673 [Aspergillus homomorphus CBS 101889]
MSTSGIPQDFPELFDFNAGGMDPSMFSQLLSEKGYGQGVGAAPEATISPQDLFLDASAPPSSTFTDLSTPPLNTPGAMFTPNVEIAQLTNFDDDWEALFPLSQEMGSLEQSVDMSQMFQDIDSVEKVPPMPTTTVENTITNMIESTVESVETTPALPVTQPEQAISPTPSTKRSLSPDSCATPSTPRKQPKRKPSTSTGVSKRQKKPLKPVEYDPADPHAYKRARNTMAARKSRERKLEHVKDLESRIAELEEELLEAQEREQYWKTKARTLGAQE